MSNKVHTYIYRELSNIVVVFQINSFGATASAQQSSVSSFQIEVADNIIFKEIVYNKHPNL